MRLVAKHAQVGYQTPGDRPGCRNCAHINRIETTGFTLCLEHGFEVTSGGICNSHKLQRKAGEAQLAFLARQRDLLEHQVQELKPSKAEQMRIASSRFRAPQARERRA